MNDVTGIAWFKDEATYRKALEVFADPESLPDNFEEWKTLVDKQCKLIKSSGDIPIRADIVPDKFLSWCATHGFPANSAARIEYVNKVVLEYKKTGKGKIIK